MTTTLATAQEQAVADYRDFIESAPWTTRGDVFGELMRNAHTLTVERIRNAVFGQDRLLGLTLDTIDGPMTVSGVEYGTEEITVTLTADGRYADRREWHRGDSDPEGWVYYEAMLFSREMEVCSGRFHGYVDPDSRKVVQTG